MTATASMLVIGDEILSGKTKDKNIGVLADALTMVGVDLVEVRIVSDDEAQLSRRSMRCGRKQPTCSPPAGSARPMTTSPPTALPKPLVSASMSIRAPTSSCLISTPRQTGR
jgi:hypothetical protein